MEPEDEINTKVATTPFMKSASGQNILNVVIALAGALIAFIASYFIIPDFTFGWRLFTVAVFDLIVLWAIDRATTVQFPLARKSVILFTLLIFIIWASYHAYRTKDEPEVTKTEQSRAKTIKLQFGENVFELKANESTPWLAFPNGTVTNYNIQSHNYDYQLLFSDNSIYEGGSDVQIPNKKSCYLKIVANSDQVVTVKVAR